MSLEHGYRWLLRAYPRSYRDRRGEEMLATLLDAAAPGQTRPSRRDTADLLVGGLRERLGLHTVPGLVAGLGVAGPIALVVATAYAGSDWLHGFRTGLSTVVTGAWVLALVARTLLPRLSAAPVLAWLVTVAAAAVAAVWTESVQIAPAVTIQVGGSPGRFAIPLMAGLIAALAALRPDARPSTVELTLVSLSVAGLLAVTVFTDGVGRRPALGSAYLLHPQWSLLYWLVPLTVLAVSPFVATLRRGTAWLWATGALLLPLPAAGGPVLLGPLGPYAGAGPALAIVMFVVALHVSAVNAEAALGAAAAAPGTARPARGDAIAALATAGSLGLGFAAALGLVGAELALAAGLTPPLIALTALPIVAAAAAVLSRWRVLVLSGAIVGQFSAMSATASLWPGSSMSGVLLILMILALVAGKRLAPGPVWAGFGLGLVLTSYVAAYVAMVRVYPDLYVEAALTDVAMLTATAILLPALWWAGVAVIRADRFWPGPLVALAVALSGPLMLAGLVGDLRLHLAIAVLAAGVLLVARIALRIGEPAPAPGPPRSL